MASKIKIINGSSSTRDPFPSSSSAFTGMATSGLPRTTAGISGNGGAKVNPIYKNGMAAPKTLEKSNPKVKSKMGKM